jgi:hypothetical protein
MDKISCITEKYSSRVIGLIILPLALALGFLGFLIIPVVGLIFSVPLLFLHSRSLRHLKAKSVDSY